MKLISNLMVVLCGESQQGGGGVSSSRTRLIEGINKYINSE